MSSLHPCPHCSRHHRACERLCPFCGGQLPACEAGSAPRSPGRMSRAMLVAAGAAALGGASCSGVALYGAPIMQLDSGAGGAGGAAGAAGTGGTSSNEADGAAADPKDAGAGS